MLAQNNPNAWQELLQMIAEKVVDEAISAPAAAAPVGQQQLFTAEPACAH